MGKKLQGNIRLNWTENFLACSCDVTNFHACSCRVTASQLSLNFKVVGVCVIFMNITPLCWIFMVLSNNSTKKRGIFCFTSKIDENLCHRTFNSNNFLGYWCFNLFLEGLLFTILLFSFDFGFIAWVRSMFTTVIQWANSRFLCKYYAKFCLKLRMTTRPKVTLAIYTICMAHLCHRFADEHENTQTSCHHH